MANGQRSEGDPGRLVGRERWKDQPGNVTSMSGRLTSAAEDLTEHGTGMEFSTWQDRQGKYTAEVAHIEPVVGGQEQTNYGAGPFRTPARAQVASEALGARVYKGRDTDRYRKGSQFSSYADLAYDGP